MHEEEITKEVLENFMGGFGRRFYKVEDRREERIVLKRGEETIVDVFRGKEPGLEIVPFRRGQRTWSIVWK